MGDDAATVEQLRAELRGWRERAERAEAEIVFSHQQGAATGEALHALSASPIEPRRVLDALGKAAAMLSEADRIGAAPTLSLKFLRLETRSPGGFDDAFADGAKHRAGALIVPADPLAANRPPAIAGLALEHRLPAMMEYKDLVRAGDLLGFRVALADLYRRSAAHVDKLLKGAKPANLPIERSTAFELVVNLPTDRGLDLAIPASVLQQATEVIQ
jgi:hypothetical protein